MKKEMEKEIQYRQGAVRGFLEDRMVEFVISDETRDRHKTVIRNKAWDLEAFRANPIAGWSHSVYGGRDWNPDNFIGRWDNVRSEDGQLVGALRFEDGETNPLADKLFRKVQNGTINAVSVGFMPGGGHYGEEDEARGGTNETYYFDSAELVEVSLVGIPSNKNARKKALENGDIPELIEELVREALGDEYREDFTLKRLFAILRGDEAEKIEEAETGEKVDAEAREQHLRRTENFNNYMNLLEEHKNELKRSY